MAVRVSKNTTARSAKVRPPEPAVSMAAAESDWFSGEQYDGQLAVDVYQTASSIIIKAAIAGVEAEDLDIAVHRDVVTVRGRRKQETTVDEGDYLLQECYWGSFSRSILLPMEVDPETAEAALRSGILTVTLQKAERSGARTVPVRDVSDEE